MGINRRKRRKYLHFTGEKFSSESKHCQSPFVFFYPRTQVNTISKLFTSFYRPRKLKGIRIMSNLVRLRN